MFARRSLLARQPSGAWSTLPRSRQASALALPRYCLGVFALLALSHAAALARPSDWATRQWEAFRAAYPYHSQVVALSNPNGAGNRVLIISEPPPGMGLQDIAAVDSQALQSAAIARTKIGFDGWAADALFELPPLDDAHLRQLIDKIHVRLFGTAYKAVPIAIPSGPVAHNADYQFDLHVPSSVLAEWLTPVEATSSTTPWITLAALVLLSLYGLKVFSSRRRVRHGIALVIAFLGVAAVLADSHPDTKANQAALRLAPLTGGPTQTLHQLFEAKSQGVFFSEKPGLVVWLLTGSSPLDDHKREARQFALDSDILLGAIGDGNRVAIIGRERVAPIALLPPLRVETILQLASVDESELSQSYERTHFFAGRFTEHMDWAPIYLSDALIDTEYGSLLNITDQLLKSWSMKAQVRYVNFKYPDPHDFPFPQPLLQYAKATRVTFNWNTKGAGYSSRLGDYDVFAWNRTGALPIDYLGATNAELRSAEETGYQYFASRNDPNLVRVVQYAELYQIFRHFHITAAARAAAAHEGVPAQFRAPLKQMLTRLQAMPEAGLRERAQGKTLTTLLTLKSQIDGVAQADPEGGLDQVADAIAAPRLYHLAHHSSEQDRRVIELAMACAQNSYLLLPATGLSRAQALQLFLHDADHSDHDWIRTPLVVMSYPVGALAQHITGGHNLDSSITSFRVSPDLSAGEVRITEENGARVILHSQADADRIPETVRTAARNEDLSSDQLASKIQSALTDAHAESRPFPDVLAFTAGHEPDAARGFEASHVAASIDRTGWWIGPNTVGDDQAAVLAALNSNGSHSIVIERSSSGGYLLFDGPSKRIVEAANEPAAVDALASFVLSGKTGVRVHLRGFAPREGKAFTQTAEVQLASFGDAPDIQATLEPSALDPHELRAILSERYNFHQVTVKDISEPFLTEEGELAVHVDAEVATAKASVPLRVRFRIVFERGVQFTADLAARIRLTILNAFRSSEIKEASDGTLLLTSKIIHDLQHISPDIKYVHAKVVHQSKDFYVVWNYSTICTSNGDCPA